MQVTELRWEALSQRWRHLLYGWFRELVRWGKSCAEIGYPSEQDSAILSAQGYLLFSHKILFIPRLYLYIHTQNKTKIL